MGCCNKRKLYTINTVAPGFDWVPNSRLVLKMYGYAGRQNNGACFDNDVVLNIDYEYNYHEEYIIMNINNVDICCGLAWGDEAKGKIVSQY